MDTWWKMWWLSINIGSSTWKRKHKRNSWVSNKFKSYGYRLIFLNQILIFQLKTLRYEGKGGKYCFWWTDKLKELIVWPKYKKQKYYEAFHGGFASTESPNCAVFIKKIFLHTKHFFLVIATVKTRPVLKKAWQGLSNEGGTKWKKLGGHVMF